MGTFVSPGIEKLGRQHYRVWWTEKLTGRRRSKVVRGPLEEAKALKARMEDSQNRGDYVPPDDVTFGEWKAWWLKRRPVVGGKRGDNRQTTIERVESLLNAPTLASHLDHIPLQRLTSEHLEAYYFWAIENEITRLGRLIQPVTIRKRHTHVRLVLETAVRKRRIPYNPADYVDLPAIEKKAGKAFTRSDVDWIRAAIVGHWLELPVIIALSTGCRVGEAVGIRRESISLVGERAVITIDGEISETKKDGVHWVPWTKTDGSRRSVIATRQLTAIIRDRLKHQAETRLRLGLPKPEVDLLCATEAGTARRPSKVSGYFSSVVHMLEEGRVLSTSGATFHTLRHTHITWLREDAQIAAEAIADHAGHEDVSTTRDYIHFGDHEQEIAEAIEVLLEGHDDAALHISRTSGDEDGAAEATP